MVLGGQKADVLMLHLLGRCNLECAHCYMEGSPHRQERLPLDVVIRALEECESLGVGSISLTGGEPLLYPGLDRVLDAAVAVPGVKITVCTNGTLLTARRADRFRQAGLRVNISVDGRPDFHDRFRKLPGAFAATESGIRTAVEFGVPVTIISTISRDNLDDVEFLVDWVACIGADNFFVQPLLDLGRGKQIADRCLTFVEMNRLIFRLSDLANQPRYRHLRCQIIGAKKKFLLEHPCGAFVRNGTRCHRGISKEIRKLVVREDGTILPEVPNLSPRFALGNIRDGSLSGLIDDYFDDGYDEFDELCRATYTRVLPNWDCVIVPWEQILSESSESWIPGRADTPYVQACESCVASRFGVGMRSAGTRHTN
ncbi:MAG TPA: radical SAM protein [Acetobacteraceae bacterium]|nr:radical SAM protein [Acetobacteraceae bacterium]